MSHKYLDPSIPWVIGIVCFVFAVSYLILGFMSSKQSRLRSWPKYRYLCWIAGILCVFISLVGPLADRAHMDFRWHMVGHLLLGMLGPLLLAIAAPMTLLLRTVPVQIARKIVKILHAKLFRFLVHPIIATVLNIGGLWLLYTTDFICKDA
ncbi:cytochrome c oxidase assembly protein [Oceanobacillus sp. J11TS1]|uniref:cytochrome c oxidase assembly protein n=1 Tax=Oceanobacillus sp. J11TS1 TaxID=2807191 RepID=UPI001AFFDFBE|nr:cytochrome c oxidase assembly protein [Oceanobacillus sp. J11TS1]GIO25018.1 hypothetical protein J11TS1_35990 [Oceanobacillus sp. J11TS1]